MTLSPACTINGGPTPADVAQSSTITGALASPAGAAFFALRCIGGDDTTTQADLDAINASLSVNQTDKTFSFLTRSGLGKALVFMVTVGVSPLSTLGSGRDADGNVVAAWTRNFKVNVLTAGGKRVVAVNETVEQDAVAGWLVQVNAAIRAVGTASGGNQGLYNTTISGTVLSGTVTPTNGSATVTTSVDHTGDIARGDAVTFASQPGTTYFVSSVAAGAITLFSVFTGTTGATATTVNRNRDVSTTGLSVLTIGGFTSDQKIDGIASTSSDKAGLYLAVVNTTTARVIIGDQSTSLSTAANRIACNRPNGGDIVLRPGGAMLLHYDTNASRWRVVQAWTQSSTPREIDARDYGAKGDRVADDWAALTATIVAVQNQPGKGGVPAYWPVNPNVLSAGYLLSRPLVWDASGFSLYGDHPVSYTIGTQLYSQGIYFGPTLIICPKGVAPPPTAAISTSDGHVTMVDPTATSRGGPYLDLCESPNGSLNGLPALTVEAMVEFDSNITGIHEPIVAYAWRDPADSNTGTRDHIGLSLHLATDWATNAVGFTLKTSTGTLILTNAGAAQMTAGTVHHVAMCFDGTAARLYIDGNYITKVTGTPGSTVSMTPYYSGAIASQNNGFPHQQMFYNVQSHMKLGIIRISATARYTNEVTPYTITKNDAAWTCDTSTIELFKFNDAVCKGVASANIIGGTAMSTDYLGAQDHGLVASISGYDPVTRAARANQLNAWHQWRNTWGPADDYVTHVRVENIGSLGYAGFFTNLAQGLKMKNCPVTAVALGHTFTNNTYTAVVEDCDVGVGGDASAVGTAFHWGVAMVTNAVITWRGGQVSGGLWSIVACAPVFIDKVVELVSSRDGNVYLGEPGGGGYVAARLKDVGAGDEAGSTAVASLQVVGTWNSVIIDGGAWGPQNVATTGDVPAIRLTGVNNSAIVRVNTILAGAANTTGLIVWENCAVPVVADCSQWNVGGFPWQWMRPVAANQGPLIDLIRGRLGTSVATVADADLVVPMNDYVFGDIVVTDTHWSGPKNVILPSVIMAGEKTVTAPGTFAATFKGPTGTGPTIAAGKTAKIRPDGTNWVRVSPDV